MSAAESPKWVPFSCRHGLVKNPWGREHWTGRHADHGIVSFGCCPPDPRRACVCPGGHERRGCCEVATQEDLLCDPCREHCVAVDEHGKYHSLVSLYGATSQKRTADQQREGGVLSSAPDAAAGQAFLTEGGPASGEHGARLCSCDSGLTVAECANGPDVRPLASGESGGAR